jgi:hypothetical protein
MVSMMGYFGDAARELSNSPPPPLLLFKMHRKSKSLSVISGIVSFIARLRPAMNDTIYFSERELVGIGVE